MTTDRETNPPTRREEDFPKTTTIPDGWVSDALMNRYNGPDYDGPVYDRGMTPIPATGYLNGANGKANGNGKVHAEDTQEKAQVESPFARRLEPFPSTWELTGMYL